MNYIYLVVTSTGYLRKTNQYGESIEPYYDWDEETSVNYHLSLAGACARIEHELAMYKKDYPDGECSNPVSREYEFKFADGTIEHWQIVQQRLYN